MTSNKFISLSTQTITLKFYYICYIMYLLHSCFTGFGIAPEKEIPQPLRATSPSALSSSQ